MLGERAEFIDESEQLIGYRNFVVIGVGKHHLIQVDSVLPINTGQLTTSLNLCPFFFFFFSHCSMSCRNFSIENMDRHIRDSISLILSQDISLELVHKNVLLYRRSLLSRVNSKFDSTCYLIWSSVELLMTWQFKNGIELLIVYDYLESIGDYKNADLVLSKIQDILKPIHDNMFSLQDSLTQKKLFNIALGLFKKPNNLDMTRFTSFQIILTDLIK